jgi:hypothetical protein
MKTHKYVWTVIIVLALVGPGLATDKVVVESKWTATPVLVDGNSADWAQDALIMNKDYSLSYAFKNDADFLYLLFVFNIKQGQRENKYMSSIDFTGLTLWANPEGKEKKTHGLHFYRKQLTGDQLIQEMEKQGQTLTEEKKQQIKSKPSYSNFACDVVNKKGEAVPNSGTSAGTFRTSKIQNNIIFEYQIPIALLQDPASAVKWDAAQPLKLGFEWGGMTEEMRKNLAARIGGQGAMAGAAGTSIEGQISGGHEGGGDFRAPESSLADSRRGIPKKYDFWIDLKVAQAGK